MEHRKMLAVFKRYWKYITLFLICIVISGLHFSTSPKWLDGDQTRMCEVIPAFDRVSKKPNVVYVLVVAYARTGSSFLVDLLTLGGSAFYLYEPSHEFLLGRNITAPEASAKILSNLFQCDLDTLKKLAYNQTGKMPLHFFWKKAKDRKLKDAFDDMIEECVHSPIRYIKTIRYGLKTAVRLLADADPTVSIKVVHLVRDPRAMLNSLRNNPSFTNSNLSAAYRCSVIRKDLQDSKLLPWENYLQIRYEDLVSNILESSVKMFNFIGSPLTDELSLFITSHKWADKFFENPDLHIYSTYRASNFDPHSWKKTMSSEDIRDIEEHCGDIIKSLNYEYQLTDVNNVTETISTRNLGDSS